MPKRKVQKKKNDKERSIRKIKVYTNEEGRKYIKISGKKFFLKMKSVVPREKQIEALIKKYAKKHLKVKEPAIKKNIKKGRAPRRGRLYERMPKKQKESFKKVVDSVKDASTSGSNDDIRASIAGLKGYLSNYSMSSNSNPENWKDIVKEIQDNSDKKIMPLYMRLLMDARQNYYGNKENRQVEEEDDEPIQGLPTGNTPKKGVKPSGPLVEEVEEINGKDLTSGELKEYILRMEKSLREKHEETEVNKTENIKRFNELKKQLLDKEKEKNENDIKIKKLEHNSKVVDVAKFLIQKNRKVDGKKWTHIVEKLYKKLYPNDKELKTQVYMTEAIVAHDFYQPDILNRIREDEKSDLGLHSSSSSSSSSTPAPNKKPTTTPSAPSKDKPPRPNTPKPDLLEILKNKKDKEVIKLEYDNEDPEPVSRVEKVDDKVPDRILKDKDQREAQITRIKNAMQEMQASSTKGSTGWERDYAEYRRQLDKLQSGNGRIKMPLIPADMQNLFVGLGNEEKGLSNTQIDQVMKKYHEYLGTIARDQIKSIIIPKIKPQSRCCWIMNTENHNQGGAHWLAVFCDARPSGSLSVEYYNSFADPCPPDIMKDLKSVVDKLKPTTFLKFKENKVKQQAEKTSNCGYFAMRFLIDRMRGKSFADATGYNDAIQNKVGKNEQEIEMLKNQSPFKYI